MILNTMMSPPHRKVAQRLCTAPNKKQSRHHQKMLLCPPHAEKCDTESTPTNRQLYWARRFRPSARRTSTIAGEGPSPLCGLEPGWLMATHAARRCRFRFPDTDLYTFGAPLVSDPRWHGRSRPNSRLTCLRSPARGLQVVDNKITDPSLYSGAPGRGKSMNSGVSFSGGRVDGRWCAPIAAALVDGCLSSTNTWD